ncbi:MAG: mercuric transport protein MerTP [Bacteroidetes bacterium]|nr:mercuric transport protein MerTP [Bacteroidota bacterium]MBU2584261.1 mercuric transport protein MerTP [Bacteroidota bacterium]
MKDSYKKKQSLETKWLGAGLLAAITASLCCITPVLAMLGGISGIASIFSFLEPLRPYLIGLTTVVLGYAFYSAYKPKKVNDIGCACENEENPAKENFLNSKAFLWVVTGVSIIMFTFPSYSHIFFPGTNNNKVVIKDSNVTEAKLYIEGMTCPSCENSVDYALKSEVGVISASSSYKTGIVQVVFDKSKVSENQLKKAVEEKVGYKVKKIKIEETN